MPLHQGLARTPSSHPCATWLLSITSMFIRPLSELHPGFAPLVASVCQRLRRSMVSPARPACNGVPLVCPRLDPQCIWTPSMRPPGFAALTTDDPDPSVTDEERRHSHSLRWRWINNMVPLMNVTLSDGTLFQLLSNINAGGRSC